MNIKRDQNRSSTIVNRSMLRGISTEKKVSKNPGFKDEISATSENHPILFTSFMNGPRLLVVSTKIIMTIMKKKSKVMTSDHSCV